MTTLAEPLISQLRAATGQLHHQLDEALALQGDRVTRERYAAFLRGSLAALEPLEAQLQSWVSKDYIFRCDLLRVDLRTLQADAHVNGSLDVPTIGSEAAALGARYVVEGSALGGAILARSFDAALGLQGEALGYLTLHGAGLAAHWRSFLAELEQFGKTATPQMRTDACESAKAVFNLYLAGFRSSGAVAVRQ